MTTSIPVIAIDGPSASGKGTVASRVAQILGWHFLDSGAIYRVLGVAALKQGIDVADEGGLSKLGLNLGVEFVGDSVLLNGVDVSLDIRTEEAGNRASKVAALPEVEKGVVGKTT